jgi:hypothetical protein
MNGNKPSPKTHAALESLDGMQRAEAPPFLLTRIQAALDTPVPQVPVSAGNRLLALLGRPVVAIGCAVAIIALNALLIFNRAKESDTASGNTGSELVANAYNAGVATVYDTDNTTEQ